MLPDFNPDTWGELEAIYLGGDATELQSLIDRVGAVGGIGDPEVLRSLNRWVRDNYLNESTSAGRDPENATAFVAWVESEAA